MDDWGGYSEDWDSSWDINTLLVLALPVPTLLFMLLGQRMDLYFTLVFVVVHEAGHLLIQIFTGSLPVIAAAGTLSVAAATVIPSLYLLQSRRTHAGAAALAMCAAILVMHSGGYMRTALTLDGHSVWGGKLTASRHDWAIIYNDLGIPLQDAEPNGILLESIGQAAGWVLLGSSLLLYACGLIWPGRLSIAHALMLCSTPAIVIYSWEGDAPAQAACLALAAAGLIGPVLTSAAERFSRNTQVLSPPSI